MRHLDADGEVLEIRQSGKGERNSRFIIREEGCATKLVKLSNYSAFNFVETIGQGRWDVQ